MTVEELRSHSIVLLGYGPNHMGLAAFLISQGISFTIRDKNEDRRSCFEKDFPAVGNQVAWETVKDVLKSLDRFTLLFRSPSIPVLSTELARAQQRGALVYSQTKLFFDLSPARIIGVTGTKGKGTTSSLIYQVLRDGWNGGAVYLGGNIGVDPFEFFGRLTASDLVVMELSSFQLQDLHRSPSIAVVLTVGADHLDHHRSVEEYATAKQSLLKYQSPDDVAVINFQEPAMERFARITPGLVYRYSRYSPRRRSAWAHREEDRETIFVQTGGEIFSFDSSQRKLLGEHNLDNILPAVIVGRLLGVPVESIAATVVSFAGLEHRLSPLGCLGGADFYEDSFATTPESTLVAVKAFPGRRIHLIVGGNEKGGDYDPLCEVIAAACATVSLLPGTAAPKLKKGLAKALKRIPGCLVLDAARSPLFPTILSGIQPHLRSGDVVVMSPAATSFASFKDYKERGRLFAEAVLERYAPNNHTV